MSASATDRNACAKQGKVSEIRMKAYLKATTERLAAWVSACAPLAHEADDEKRAAYFALVEGALSRNSRASAFSDKTLPIGVMADVLTFLWGSGKHATPFRSVRHARAVLRAQLTCASFLFLIRENPAVKEGAFQAASTNAFPMAPSIRPRPAKLRHVRCVAAASLTALHLRDADSYLLIPMADCMDALLRQMVLAVCGSSGNNLVCLRTGMNQVTNDEELTQVFRYTGEKIGEPVKDPRSVAYVQHKGQQAVAILENTKSRIRICNVFDWDDILSMIDLPDDGLVHTVVALQDRELIAVSNCTSKKAVFIIDVSSGECLRTISFAGWWPTGLALLPDGTLAVAEYQGGVSIINPMNGDAIKTIVFNKGFSIREKVTDFQYVDRDTEPTKQAFRPSRLTVLPRVSGVVGDGLAYDLLVLDDDYARQVMRVSLPDFCRNQAPVEINHLYQMECGAVVPLPEAQLPFRERLAVLNHGEDGAVHVINMDDPKGHKKVTFRSSDLCRPLGMCMVPLPELPLDDADATKELRSELVDADVHQRDDERNTSRRNSSCDSGSDC